MNSSKIRPLLMGVLNATPDSFFDKGAYFSLEKGIERGLQIVKEGADILDIGGASSRPGAPLVAVEEEIRRVVPLIEALASQVSIPISVDTTCFEVAKLGLDKGASLINDVNGFKDPKMQELAAQCDADLCVMHSQGTPQTMQLNPSYPNRVVDTILHFFETQIIQLTQAGVRESRIILDPGIGFGKTIDHNLAIFKAIGQFKQFGLRVLIGASRKGFMSKILNKPATELLSATLATHMFAFLKGADMIRTHDIKEHRDALAIIAHFL